MSDQVSLKFPDNGGRVATTLQIIRVTPDTFEVRVQCEGKGYASKGGGPSELREEHGARGGPIECTADELIGLASGLGEWLSNRTLFDWQIGAKHGPRLAVRVDRPENIITTRDKPALAFEYANSGYFSARWKFIADPTCLEGPQAELGAFAKGTAPGRRGRG